MTSVSTFEMFVYVNDVCYDTNLATGNCDLASLSDLKLVSYSEAS